MSINLYKKPIESTLYSLDSSLESTVNSHVVRNLLPRTKYDYKVVKLTGGKVYISKYSSTARVVSKAIPSSTVYSDSPIMLSNAMIVNGVIRITGKKIESTSATTKLIDTSNLSTRCRIIIEDCVFRTPGMAIFGYSYNHDWEIRNNFFFGRKDLGNSLNDWGRWAIRLNDPYSCIIENNYIEDTGGFKIEFSSWSTTNCTGVTIQKNKAKNIYQPDGLMNYINLTSSGASIKNLRVQWEEVTNTPGACAVEDTINIYNLKGTSTDYGRVSNIFLDGAFHKDYLTKNDYSGGGLIFDGSGSTTVTQACEYWLVENNQAIRQANYCFGFATCRNSTMRGNRAVVSRRYADNSEYVAHTSGFWSDDYSSGKNVSAGLLFENNVSGVNARYGGRLDYGYYNNDHTTSTNNISLPDPITRSTEDNEILLWNTKKEDNGIITGPIEML